MRTKAEEAAPCRCRRPLWWSVMHSLWALPTILGLGMLTWVSFGYIAARTRKWSLAALAVVFFVATAVAFNSVSEVATSNTGGTLAVLIWTGGMLAAAIVNPSYLRLRWRLSGRCTCDPTVADHAPRHAHPGVSHNDAHATPMLDDPKPMYLIQDRLPDRSPVTSASPTAPAVSMGATLPPPTPTPCVQPSPQESPTKQSEPGQQWHTREETAPPSAVASQPPLGLVNSSLGDAVVHSHVYKAQRDLVRAVLSDEVVAQVIDSISSRPGARISDAEIATALGVPLSRVPGGVSCLPLCQPGVRPPGVRSVSDLVGARAEMTGDDDDLFGPAGRQRASASFVHCGAEG